MTFTHRFLCFIAALFTASAIAQVPIYTRPQWGNGVLCVSGPCTIDNAVIGGTTPAAITGTTITATTFNVGSSATQLSEFSAGFLLIRGVTANNGGNIRKAGDNGGYVQWASATELLTLSTGGTTTDTAGNLLPADAFIEAVTARVTTTITTATSWQLGDPTTPGRFTSAQSTMTAGAIVVGLVHIDQAGAAGPRQTAVAKVRVTTVGTPGAGVIRITVYYRQYVAPTS